MTPLTLQEQDTQHVDPPMDFGNAYTSAGEPPEHARLRTDDFWRRIPGFASVGADEFQTHTFQARHTATNIRQIRDLLGNLAFPILSSRMSRQAWSGPRCPLRISPYLLGLIDWSDPTPILFGRSFCRWLHSKGRIIPSCGLIRWGNSTIRRCRASRIATRQSPFPSYQLLPGLLPLLHAQLCHRRRHGTVEKLKLGGGTQRWDAAFAYIASRPELEDIVISGGDTYNLRRRHIQRHRGDAAEHAKHPPHSLRDQRTGCDAAENTQR